MVCWDERQAAPPTAGHHQFQEATHLFQNEEAFLARAVQLLTKHGDKSVVAGTGARPQTPMKLSRLFYTIHYHSYL